jgi:hypothetical protein
VDKTRTSALAESGASYCDTAAVVEDASVLSFAAVVVASPLSLAASMITVRVEVLVRPWLSLAT